MKKRVLSLALAGMLAAGTLAGCGGSSEEGEPGGEETEYFSGDEEGKVINIYSWDDEFASRLQEYYPGVKETSKDGTVTTLEDGTEIHWTINPSENGVYQDKLDKALKRQADAPADEKIDMFLAETDCLVKYTDMDSDMAVPLSELGIDADEDLADQYQYTKDAACDDDGEQRAVSWQACPGVMIYRRSIAKDVLGTDDPDKVSELCSDWEKFDEVAGKLKEKGYYALSSIADTQRIFANNTSAPWVEPGDTTVKVDQAVMDWIDQAKSYMEKGYAHSADGQLTDTWNMDQSAEGRVFSFFGPAWFLSFTLQPNYGQDADPDWAVCEAPMSFNWGGSFLLACTGTDNREHVADIMKTLTADKDTLLKITEGTLDYTNTVSGMKELAKDDEYNSDFLGGENPYGYFGSAAESIVMDKLSAYDQGCLELINTGFTDYINGKADLDKAKADFESAIKDRYPEITGVEWP